VTLEAIDEQAAVGETAALCADSRRALGVLVEPRI